MHLYRPEPHTNEKILFIWAKNYQRDSRAQIRNTKKIKDYS